MKLALAALAALLILACDKAEVVATPVDDFRTFTVSPGSNIRIQTQLSDVDTTARLICGGKQVRSWSANDPIELKLDKTCNLEWTLTGTGTPRDVKFIVETDRGMRTMTFNVGSRSTMRLNWQFGVAP